MPGSKASKRRASRRSHADRVNAPSGSDGRSGLNVARFGFSGGAYFEIIGPQHEGYHVRFIDRCTDEILHEETIPHNALSRTALRYFKPWTIAVTRASDQALVFLHHYDARDRRVYIAMASRSLGDTLAWMPAVAEFRRIQGCHVICSTFLNRLFIEAYPEIEFVEPGATVHNLYAMYEVGLFYTQDGRLDGQRNPLDFRRQPLAKAAYDILGLPYRERRPRLALPMSVAPIAEPYVCIAVHATAQAKYWNNPSGWPEIVEFLKNRGFRVLLLSREGHEYMGNLAPELAEWIPEGPIETIIRYLQHTRLFIGVGSGLSWLAWAVGCPTCLISGFSEPYTEPAGCLRIFPEGVGICTGCFNQYRLDPTDWLWCPVHADQDERRFECTRTITSTQVIESITSLLNQ